MKPLAVFYHCLFSSRHRHIDSNFAMLIMAEQMADLQESGLADAAQEIHICCNSGPEYKSILRELAPKKSLLHFNGHGAFTEVPTMYFIQEWLPAHKDWYVLYYHIKGVTKPHDTGAQQHRRNMGKAMVREWRRCVDDMDHGYDAVGWALVHPKKRPLLPGCFFIGNFWWAKASYMLKLAKMPPAVKKWSDPERCRAEGWIGTAWKDGKFMDYSNEHLYRP